jgi:hypothetical protein
MSLLGVVPLLVLAAVVVTMGQRGVIVNVGVPGGPVFEVVTEAPAVVVADVPMVVAMLGCWMGMLGFLPLAFGPLPDVCHRRTSFRVDGYLETLHSMCQSVEAHVAARWHTLCNDR